jgi:hypothetical protein
MSTFSDQLEGIVDRSTVKHILETLATICQEKAQHIRENWQDRELAKEWQHTAMWINSIVQKVTV